MEEQKLVDELQFMNKNNNNKHTDYIQFSKQRTYINNFNPSEVDPIDGTGHSIFPFQLTEGFPIP